MRNAILVLLDTKTNTYDISYLTCEMKNLCKSIDIDIKHHISQKLDKPNKEYLVGSGKIKEVKELLTVTNIDLVVFDDELTLSQLRNISEYLNVEVIDRTYVILSIFALRAQSREAILEINLAKSRYLLPRLSIIKNKEDRQGGSSSLHNKGKGETRQELDKRVLLANISRCTKELVKIKEMKDRQTEKRKENNIPIVALVGYTNAGKSSTLNKIIEYTKEDSEKMVYAKDELFATLSTKTRSITYKKHKFLLTDTIGFVSKLPHHLINSFNSTLKEIKNADLILHIIDVSSPYFNEQYAVTAETLNNLGCSNIKTLLVFNKYDKCLNKDFMITGAENILYSNYDNYNVDKLLDYIYDNTISYMIDLKLNIPYTNGKLINIIETHGIIKYKSYTPSYVIYEVSIDKKYYKQLEFYEIDNFII